MAYSGTRADHGGRSVIRDQDERAAAWGEPFGEVEYCVGHVAVEAIYRRVCVRPPCNSWACHGNVCVRDQTRDSAHRMRTQRATVTCGKLKRRSVANRRQRW